jgi:hypothetical protein
MKKTLIALFNLFFLIGCGSHQEVLTGALPDQSNIKHYGELVNGVNWEQTFIAAGSTLKEVDIYLATFSRVNKGNLILEILDSKGNLLAKEVRPLNQIQDNEMAKFKFDSFFNSLKVNLGSEYKIRLTSPNSSSANAISWWASSVNKFADGNAIINGYVQNNSDFGFQLIFEK